MNLRGDLIIRLQEAQSLAARLNAATVHFLIGVALLDLAEPERDPAETKAGRKKAKLAKPGTAGAALRVRA